jgi:Flp pilus assembly pilin Flp
VKIRRASIGSRYTPPALLLTLLTAITALWILLAVAWLWPQGQRALAAAGIGLLLTILGAASVGFEGWRRIAIRRDWKRYKLILIIDREREKRQKATDDRDFFYKESRKWQNMYEAERLERERLEGLLPNERQEQIARWGLRDNGVSLTEYSVILAALAIALVSVLWLFGQGIVHRLYHIILTGWPQ